MDIKKLMVVHPEIAEMADYKEIFWLNPNNNKENEVSFTEADIDDAEARLKRFMPYIMSAFPETIPSQGLIESKLVEIPDMKARLAEKCGDFSGKLFLKCDSHLPISGSIKARGGIYEVLKLAEKIALEKGLITLDSDYSKLNSPEARELFSKYSVAVGSTGNLGLSIGIISAKLGFDVTVHMSMDARQWKKDLLREKGAKVIEYPDDYQKAVSEGRKNAAKDPMCHFVDDEGSADLFLGYSVAAKRLVPQLKEAGITVDSDHPLYVYLPCGVGGAPGGVSFGLKKIFGENVHIFFAEPTHAPCMTLGLISELYDGISVKDLGLNGLTAADGLAVGRASRLVSTIMSTMLEGLYTIEDYKLYPFLSDLADSENIFIEPSATATFEGPSMVEKLGLGNKNATHILWATGGNMVPEDEMKSYYKKGKAK